MIDQGAHLFTTLSGIQRFRASLHRIRHAVGLRAPTPLPQWMQREPTPVGGSREHSFRHHRKPATHTGEPTVFRKTAEFYGAVACTGNFENGMGNFRLG